MSMNNFASIPALDAAAVLKRFHLHADKSLGQNFLQDASALEKIALAAEMQADDCVLEIGPGLGSFTRYLAVSAKQVTAVELDPDMLAPLGQFSRLIRMCAWCMVIFSSCPSQRSLTSQIIWWLPTSRTTSPRSSSAICWRVTSSPAAWY